MGKAYQSIAYLAKGHWEPTIQKLEEAGEYEKTKLLDKKSKTFELWFVFSDFFPKSTSSVSQLDLPDLMWGPVRNHPEVKKAFEDLKRENQWRDDTTTALDIHDSLHNYIEYKTGSFTEKQSKIAFWRTCKPDKDNKEKLEIPFLIKPKDKDYGKFCKLYDIPEKKSILHMSPKTELKYMNIYEAFVIDEILEVRHAKITANGEYTLYDEKPKTRKLLKKGNIQEEHNAEDLKRIKAQVKHIEKAILDSGSAQDSDSARDHITRISAGSQNYSTSVNTYVSNPEKDSVGAWIAVIVIAIVIMFLIFSSMH